MGDKKKHYEKPLAIDASFEEAFKILVKEDKGLATFQFRDSLLKMATIFIQIIDENDELIFSKDNVIKAHVFFDKKERFTLRSFEYSQKMAYQNSNKTIHINIPENTTTARVSIEFKKPFKSSSFRVIAKGKNAQASDLIAEKI